jgi:hypothetical protein
MTPVRHTVAALASACLFTACGGGGSDASDAIAPTPVASPTFVRLEGCVVDQHDLPRAATVHASSEDGRVLDRASSNPQGVFVLKVPARQKVSIGLDASGEETPALLTGSTNLSLGACLRETLS